MRAVINAALASPRLILLLLILVFVAGAVTYITIPKESEPDIPIPYVGVTVSLEGISPEDAERLLVRPIEQAVRAIEGVKTVTSNAGQGYGSITLEFEAGLDSEKSLRDVRRKVDEIKGQLPTDADEPVVQEFNVALFPVLTIVLSGQVPERALNLLARSLKNDLLGVKGVLDVEIGGARDEMLEININPEKMEAYGLSQEELFTLFARNNRLIAAGALDTGKGRFAVKLPGTLTTVEDIINLPVKVVGSKVVRFSDVATITRNFKDADRFARYNGQSALTLEVKKRLGANIIDTIARVRAVTVKHQALWPANVKVDYSQDNSKDIKNMLNELQNGVLLAVLLVVAVLVLTMGWRNALLVAIAIPGSFLMGILAIGMGGLTVNVVVLFGLIMAVGMLVDDAIIVAEYADRKMAEGLPAPQAYREATHRMVGPIIASTATRLAVFFPLLFWPGIVGGFMSYLPITLIATLTASLIMAVIFLPVLGAYFGRTGATSKAELEHTAAAEMGDLSTLKGGTGKYLTALHWCISHPKKTFAIGLAMLVSIFGCYGFLGAGVEFFPNTEPNNVMVQIHARGDLSASEKDVYVKQVENNIIGLPGIANMYAQSGRQSGNRSAADLIGVINIELADWNTRAPAAQLLDTIKQRTANIKGVVINTEVQQNGPGQGKPIQIELSTLLPLDITATNQRLAQAADAIHEATDKLGGFTDYEDSRPLSGIEWQMKVNRAEAAKYGADLVGVGTAVQMVTNGILLGKTRPEDVDDEIDIRARYTAAGRNLDELANLQITTRTGLVPISNFVTRVAAPKVTTIARTDAHRVLKVGMNVATGKNVDAQVKALQAYFEKHPDPRISAGIRVQFKGENEDQAESSAFLMKAFGFAIFLMLMILVAQFNSFYQTLLILSAVLFAIGAVLLGLMIIRAPFGIVMGGIGVISLAGIIVNNNIILIDTFNHFRREGKSPEEALMRTGAMRLRPVLLTALTAILGLLPMCMGITLDFINREVSLGAPGAVWWVQLASAVAGGLAFATPITLLLTPALLMWREQSLAKKAAKRAVKQAELSAV